MLRKIFKEPAMPLDIPEVVVERLPLYARTLQNLADRGCENVSSQELGDYLGVTPAQIRKDLSYFGRFGKQGRGYNVCRLLDELRQILGLDRSWTMALLGVGQLGRAILHYAGFAPQGFRIVEAFDNDPATVGEEIAGLTVRDIQDLPSVLAMCSIEIGIVAVPAHQAQAMFDLLVSAGVKAILNYAPVAPRVPPNVHVRSIDPVLALQSMTFYLKEGALSSK
jgi:redox-sensing transcriptional repressor